jgi:hypothetical protein
VNTNTEIIPKIVLITIHKGLARMPINIETQFDVSTLLPISNQGCIADTRHHEILKSRGKYHPCVK